MNIFRRWFSFFNIVNQVSNRYRDNSRTSRSFSRVIIRGNSEISNSQIGNVMINGKSYRGSNISVEGDSVILDGKILDEYRTEKIVNISIVGDIDSVEGGSRVTVTGNVGLVSTTSGDVDIYGTVNKGIITTSGDVTVDSTVTGNVSTVSGNVTVAEVVGNVKTITGNVIKKGHRRYE